jgi:hypothetical protein
MRIGILLVLVASLIVTPAAFASDDEDKHENYLKTSEDLDLGEVVVEAGTVTAQENVVVFKAKMKNVTQDWIFVRKHEIEFQIGGKTVKPYSGKEKPAIVIGPEKSKSLSLKLKGSGFHVEEMTVDFKGIYKAAATGEVMVGSKFVYPPSSNNVSMGPFKCSVTSHDQATKVTKTTWECQYTGDGIGYVDASGLSVKIESGEQFASTFRKNKKVMLKHNEKAKFTTTFEIEKRIVDMQFAQLELLWGETFSESQLEAVDSDSWDFEFDEELTAEKND